MLRWILHDWFGVHRPGADASGGFVPVATCRDCGCRILKDSSGAWFPAQTKEGT